MNYHKIYTRLVSSKLYRGTNKLAGFELHHITPKSLGGTDDINNLVLFTPREHLVAHLLLVRMAKNENEKRKMGYALNMMMQTREDGIKITSKIYETFRLSYNNLHISKTPEWKAAQSIRQKEVMKDRVGINLNGKTKTVKRSDLQSMLDLGWKLGYAMTPKMIAANKNKSELARLHGPRKVTKLIFDNIFELYNSKPFIDIEYIKNNRPKGATRPVVYEREFCKIYAKNFNLTPNGLYNIISGKNLCPLY